METDDLCYTDIRLINDFGIRSSRGYNLNQNIKMIGQVIGIY